MSTTKIRANKIATVIVPTANQDAAIDFYVNTLGFTLRVEQPFGPEEGAMRWIEVGPEGEDFTTVALAPPPQERDVQVGGRETGITIYVEDIDAYYDQLKAAGTDVDEAIMRMGDPVPPMFWFRDPEGNSLTVVG